jgi:hypothetical protein
MPARQIERRNVNKDVNINEFGRPDEDGKEFSPGCAAGPVRGDHDHDSSRSSLA